MNSDPDKPSQLILTISRLTGQHSAAASEIVRLILRLVAEGLIVRNAGEFLETVRGLVDDDDGSLLSEEDEADCLRLWAPEAASFFGCVPGEAEPHRPASSQFVANVIVLVISRKFKLDIETAASIATQTAGLATGTHLCFLKIPVPGN